MADICAPEYVDARLVDLDNIRDGGDPPAEFPRGVGFEELVADAMLEEGKDYVWEAA